MRSNRGFTLIELPVVIAEKLKSKSMASRKDAKAPRKAKAQFIRAIARKGGFETIRSNGSEVLTGEAGKTMVSFAPLRLCAML